MSGRVDARTEQIVGWNNPQKELISQSLCFPAHRPLWTPELSKNIRQPSPRQPAACYLPSSKAAPCSESVCLSVPISTSFPVAPSYQRYPRLAYIYIYPPHRDFFVKQSNFVSCKPAAEAPVPLLRMVVHNHLHKTLVVLQRHLVSGLNTYISLNKPINIHIPYCHCRKGATNPYSKPEGNPSGTLCCIRNPQVDTCLQIHVMLLSSLTLPLRSSSCLYRDPQILKLFKYRLDKMPARTTAILWAFFFTTCLSPPQSRLFFLQLLLVQYFVFSSYLHLNYSSTSLAGSCLLACNKTGHVLCWKKPPQLPPCELRPPKKNSKPAPSAQDPMRVGTLL